MRDRPVTLSELAADPRLVLHVGPEHVERLLKQAAALTTLLASQLQAPAAPEPGPRDEPDEWLTARQVAERFNLTRRQVRSLSRRRDWAPFTRRVNARTTRYGQNGVRSWFENGASTEGLVRRVRTGPASSEG